MLLREAMSCARSCGNAKAILAIEEWQREAGNTLSEEVGLMHAQGSWKSKAEWQDIPVGLRDLGNRVGEIQSRDDG